MNDAWTIEGWPPRLWVYYRWGRFLGWLDRVSHYQERVIERLREQLAKERARRQDELREMATGHTIIVALAEKGRLDAIQLAETRRVDANRASDVAATILANTQAGLTANTLAEKVSDSASTLVTQVEQTKDAASLANKATADALSARIKPLEDARYEQAGRTGGRVDVTKVMWAIIAVVGPIVVYILTRPGVAL